MSHHPKTKFAHKHPSGTTADPAIKNALKAVVKEGRVSCAAAHRVANELNVSAGAVGVAIDLLEYRLVKCQMGLFGYSPRKRIVTPSKDVDPAVKQIIMTQVTDQRLECAAAWQIAAHLEMPRMAVANICEGMGIKIAHCQLGAF